MNGSDNPYEAPGSNEAFRKGGGEAAGTDRWVIYTEITIEDLVALAEHFDKHHPQMRRRRRHIFVIAMLVVFLLSILAWLATDSWMIVVISLLAFPLFLAFLFWQVRVQLRRLTRSIRSRSSNASITGNQRFVIDEQGVARHHTHGYGVTYWSGIDRIEEGPDHFFLFVGALEAHAIPKRDIADVNAFRDDIHRRLESVPASDL